MQYKDILTGEVVTAHQWLKNGDHPDDYATPIQDYEGGHLVTYSPLHQLLNDWEGQVVRRYRRPGQPGDAKCPRCLRPWDAHGFIDNPAGITVHPGDWVVTGQGQRKVIWNAYFLSNFEPLGGSA